MNKYLFSSVILSLCCNNMWSQNTYVPLESIEYQHIERMEALEGAINPNLHSALKPYSRIDAINTSYDFTESYHLLLDSRMNPVDLFNANRIINLNGEYGKPNHMYDDATTRRESPILRYFYETEPHLYLYSNEGTFLSINPVLYFQAGLENNHSDIKFINARGAEIRAKLFDKIGVYTFLAETQENGPNYFVNAATKWKAFPGYDFHTMGSNRSTLDGFMTRAYVDIPIYKKWINLNFGFDKQFIGDGIRSMLLSNSGAPSTYVRLRSEFGSFKYQNLFMELMPNYYQNLDKQLPRKYATFHYLGWDAHPKFSLGLFESTMFNAVNTVNINNFIPVIGYNSIASIVDSNNTNVSNIGLNAKYIPTKHVQLYGQLVVNNIDLGKLSEGYWNNKWASQLGVKYFEAFNINNLDLQMEWNHATAFMYATDNYITSYIHYNQPLAHPMLNGFNEIIFNAYYQPLNKLHINLRYHNIQKINVDNASGNIFVNTSLRTSNNGYQLNKDNVNSIHYFNINGAYELFTNFFIEAGGTILSTSNKNDKINNSNMIYTGIRWNIQKRNYDFAQL